MKTLKKILAAFIILAFVTACEPPVTFSEAQPTGSDNLQEFPKNLSGSYISLSDNSTLDVKAELIQRIYDYNYKTSILQLDSNLVLSGDTIANTSTGEKTLIERVGDSIITRVYFIDTLFRIGEEGILRKFKGYYFLNTRQYDGSWEVKKMNLSRGRLIVGKISTVTDLGELKEITETSQDTVPPYKFTVTKKQFRKFIKSGGFSDDETFIRVNK